MLDKTTFFNFVSSLLIIDKAGNAVQDIKSASASPKSMFDKVSYKFPIPATGEPFKIKGLKEVIELWKEKDLYKSTRFAASTIKDTEQRLMNWIDLKAYKPSTNKVIADNYQDLKIGFKRMIEITKSDLVAWHAAITNAGSYQANRAMDDMWKFFSYFRNI